MQRTFLGIIFFLLTGAARAQHAIRFEIRNLPASTPAGSILFLAGSFNDWNPADERFRFERGPDGVYFLGCRLPAGKYEYKITRGSWNKVECSSQGKPIANRTLHVEGDAGVPLQVEGWQDAYAAKPRVSTAGPHVRILDTAFWIPQLQRKRRIWIYLPEGYSTHRRDRYPVLYMQDGQNVFDELSSFSGEWGVDEYFDTALVRAPIVVAVDHGGGKRMNEYNPWDHERFGKGEGDLYVDFIVRTLKPYMDKNYNTDKRRKGTWIAGSSMGGLISMYAILKYPKVFGGAGIFSPAFWTAPSIFELMKQKGRKVKGHLFFYAGKQEGESMVPLVLKAVETLSAVSKSKLEAVIRDEGKHTESDWRREFPAGFGWILYGKPPSLVSRSR